jgi:ABC-2 type transport system permease protein
MSETGIPVPGAPDAVTRTIVGKTLWECRRSVASWTLSIAAVGVLYAAFWPSMEAPAMQQAIASYPEELLKAMNYTDLGTAAGYIGSTVYGLLAAVLVAVYAISAGARVIAGEEEDGILDIILAHPVGRVRIALERFTSIVITIVLMTTVLWISLVAISGPASLDGISIGQFAAASLQLTLFGVAIGSVSFAVGAATGRRGLALGVASAIAVLGYLEMGVFPQVQWLEWTRDVTPWTWYLGGKPLANGVQLGDCCLLVAMAVVMVGGGTWAFTRRDIGV